MTFDAESVREWNPSEMTLTAPVEYPSTSFAAATARLSPRTRRSTRPTSRWRAAAALALDSGTAKSFQTLGTSGEAGATSVARLEIRSRDERAAAIDL